MNSIFTKIQNRIRRTSVVEHSDDVVPDECYEPDGQAFSAFCPETVIIFNTFKREEISKKSFLSLLSAIAPFRDRIKIVVSESSPTPDKAIFFQRNGADDVIWTPTFVAAATQRNLCMELIRDKYSSEYVCLLEDDYEYTLEWYPTLLRACKKNFGRMSPWGMPYGMFSASNHPFQKNRVKMDEAAGILATFHGTVADQRFMPMAHYEAVLRFWDPDLLGVSLCQTGMQTSRHAMRGFCGGVLPSQELCWEIPEQTSTWRGGERDVGPGAHSMDPDEYSSIRKKAAEAAYTL